MALVIVTDGEWSTFGGEIEEDLGEVDAVAVQIFTESGASPKLIWLIKDKNDDAKFVAKNVNISPIITEELNDEIYIYYNWGTLKINVDVRTPVQ